MINCDIVVIGGGPAGLACSITAGRQGKKVVLIEREGKLGGILKQCIHDGFGITRFRQRLTGPEYAYREIEELAQTEVKVMLLTFVTKIEKSGKGFSLSVVNPAGVEKINAEKVVLSTGCRERTSKQVLIQGTNPAGIMTAGQVQYYINVLGKMPVKKCVILGSGDIGLIMARRVTLEGGIVEGVYEVKSTPSGLSRNIAQCLNDFDIPIYLSHTVTRVFGADRLEGVEIAEVDEKMRPIKGTERRVDCDSLILSVGLIPENELAKSINVPLSIFTKGPLVDQSFETMVKGVYTCGNAMHVNDLADYVSESGEIAGLAASKCESGRADRYDVNFDCHFGYVVPSFVDANKSMDNMVFYFRSHDIYKDKVLVVKQKDKEIMRKTYSNLKPPEMERILISLESKGGLQFSLEDR